jgi:hypothetical protein
MRAFLQNPPLFRHSLAVALLLTTLAAAPAAAAPALPPDASVASEWNEIAVGTFVADPNRRIPDSILYVGFVHAAVYDAVVGVRGRYTPYTFDRRAPHGASAQAAAVAAAHRILVTYEPYAQATLDARYAGSLSRIPDGRAKTTGVAYGNRVADHLVALRAHDGRDAPVQFTKPPAPGVWRPTPPQLAPFLDPWLGGVTPLLIRSATQFGPAPPPALTSARYTRDFAEVKAVGAKNSTVRTPDQTATATFYSGSSFVQFNALMRDQATVRGLDIVDAARLFAAGAMSAADGAIATWHAKYGYGLWRPITAVNLADTDGNPATDADPAWEPWLVNPPYPDYVSGYNAYAATVTRALERVLRTRRLNLTVISSATPEIRHYETGEALRQDVVNVRVWQGIHFRFADLAAKDLGARIADWATDHYFQRCQA